MKRFAPGIKTQSGLFGRFSHAIKQRSLELTTYCFGHFPKFLLHLSLQLFGCKIALDLYSVGECFELLPTDVAIKSLIGKCVSLGHYIRPDLAKHRRVCIDSSPQLLHELSCQDLLCGKEIRQHM